VTASVGASARRFGLAGLDHGRAVAPLPGGGVVLAVTGEGPLDFGCGFTLAAGDELGINQDLDVFITALLPGGACAWSKRLRIAGQDRVDDIAVDLAGNIYAVGWLDFWGDVSRRMFVARFNADGTEAWRRELPAETESHNIKLGPDGNLYISGAVWSSIDFGGGVLSSAPGSSADVFLASYTPAGIYRWARRFGYPGYQAPSGGLAISAQGDLVIAGQLASGGNFGGGVIQGTGFVASFGLGGAHRWSRGYAGAYPGAVAVGVDGAIFLAGWIPASADLGGGSLPAGSFLAGLSRVEGALDWSRSVPLSQISDLAIDTSDQLYVAAAMQVASFTSAGTSRWTRASGEMLSIAYGNGYVHAAGQLRGTTTIDGAPMTSVGSSNGDILLHRLSP
jgi:hypothetical protein